MNINENKIILDTVRLKLDSYEKKKLHHLKEDTFIKEKNKALNKVEDLFGVCTKEELKHILLNNRDYKTKYGFIDKSTFASIGSDLLFDLKNQSIDEITSSKDYIYTIPYLCELIFTKSQPKDITHNIVIRRLNELKDLKERKDVFNKKYKYRLTDDELDKENYKYDVYLISYYYAMLLYKIFKDDELYLLKEVRDVLLREKITKELLSDFNILDKWDLVTYSLSYEKLLKKIDY